MTSQVRTGPGGGASVIPRMDPAGRIRTPHVTGLSPARS